MLVAVSIIALQLLRLSYTVFPLETVIEVSPLQPVNAKSPIEVTEFGMINDAKPLQLENAPPQMVVIPVGIE